jgi:hypothetical protein
MSDSTALDAGPWQRVGATLLNLGIVLVLITVVGAIITFLQWDQTAVPTIWLGQVTVGVVYWLGCGRARTSPGLWVFKLKVVPSVESRDAITTRTALLRPLPYFLFGILLTVPPGIIPPALVPVEYLLLLTSTLLLAANSAPLWSGPNRRSLLDRWLQTRVILPPPSESPTSASENEGSGI